MSRLLAIKPKAQQIAETVSAVLGVETEIVDNEFTIVAGTGQYKSLVGTKDYEAKYRDSQYLYARVLQTGQTFVIENASCDSLYGPRDLGEIGEICCAIRLWDEVIGILALVAFDHNQRSQLLSKKDSLSPFLQNMASMLASHVAEVESYNKLALESKRLEVIIESINRGIIAVDQDLIITHCNQEAATLTGRKKQELLGHSVNKVLPGHSVGHAIKTGQFSKDKEEFYRSIDFKRHLLVSSAPIIIDHHVLGAVSFFRDLDEARKIAYAISNTDISLEFDHIKGQSSKVIDLKKQALRVAQGNSTVLIVGESGTGKELFARAIHFASPRKERPLVVVNCGAIPETLLESELFGYEEGAFTGARKGGRPGKFELADGGTIFLDEIGDLPLHLQVKLLHVLQRKQVERVGSNKVIPIDVRVLAATNRNLEVMCTKGEFRDDLFYRLSVIPLVVPPLRERQEDIEILLGHFLMKYCQLMSKPIQGLSDDVRRAFMSYHWPGNIRELENAIEYAVNMETLEFVCLDSIPSKIKAYWHRRDQARQINLEEQLKYYEKQLLLGYLKQVTEGKLKFSQLPTTLEISRATLYRKLKQYGLA